MSRSDILVKRRWEPKGSPERRMDMAIMSMKQVLGAVNDKTVVKIYKGKQFITKGNWFQDNILDYSGEYRVMADLDASTNICKVNLEVKDL